MIFEIDELTVQLPREAEEGNLPSTTTFITTVMVAAAGISYSMQNSNKDQLPAEDRANNERETG